MRKSSARPRQFLNRRGAADVVARAADAVPLVVPAHVEPIGVRRTPAPAPVERAFAHDALRERPLRGRPGFLHGRPRGRREPEQASCGQRQHHDDDSGGGGDRQEIGLAGEEAPRGNEPHRNAPAEQGARPRHHPGVGRIEREDRFVRMVRIDSADGPPFGHRRISIPPCVILIEIAASRADDCTSFTHGAIGCRSWRGAACRAARSMVSKIVGKCGKCVFGPQRG